VADPIVGIDLGTSNTVVAHADDGGTVRVLADEGGFKIHPSVVSFHPNGGVVVGAAAKQRKVIDPKNTIYSVKRLIGRTYNAPEVQIAKSRMPFQIKEGPNQQPLVVTRGGEFAVPEISAIVLDHARNIASHELGMPVSRAVVTVPASFNDAQRSATATAGAIAGLTIVRVLNEPTAAALAYGNTRNLNQTIAVFDFGGGTFDITILKLHDQVYEVLGTAGDTFLGGDDLDERLVDRMVEKFLAENRIDLRTNEVSMMRLRAVAEQTKIELSRRSRAVVRIDEIAYGPRGKPLDLQIEIKRDEFVSQVADLIDRTFPVCQEALAYASLTIDRIDDVILVGGTTKIPYVRDQVAKFFARAPRTDVSPEDAVAIGAGLQATSLERILRRKSPSKVTGAQRVPVEFQDGDTTASRESYEEYTDAQATTPDSDFPVPQISPEDDSILSLLPPAQQPQQPAARKRQTAGYETVRRTGPTQTPDHDRPAARGQHHDRFEDRTPTPAPTPTPVPTQPIARMTRTGIQTPVPPEPPSSGVVQKTTKPQFTTTQPIARTTTQQPAAPPPRTTTQQKPPSRVTGVQPVAPPPTPPPSRRAPSVPPPAGLAPLPPMSPPMSPPMATPQAPTLVVEPPQPPARPAPFPAMPPEPATRPAMPQIAAHAATMMIDPATDSSAASTARGMGPLDTATMNAASTARGMAPATTARGIPTQEPSPASTNPLFPPAAPPPPSAASTAPGFVGPQTYPVQSMPMPATRNPVVLDVTPRSLGIATVAGYCEELIRRNARVPTETRKLFTTSRDDQDTVRIIVCQGESRRLDSNVVLGDLTLQGLPPRPRGETSIEVTFQLDASGILQVRARDAHTGREQRASLDLAGAMPQSEVDASRERMQALRR
jgi:molecular chaperone DnaK